MAKYTTLLRTICEEYAGMTEQQPFSEIDNIIETARPKLFDFSYPIFDESYKPILERKIIKTYYMREIGAETVGLFKLFLCNTLNENMPYFNQLYKSEKIKIEPLADVSYKREYKRTTDTTNNQNGTVSDTSTTETTGKNKSDTVNNNIRTDDLTQSRTGSNSSTRTDDLKNGMSESTEGSGNNNDTDAYSETPQGTLANVANMTYLTNARIKNGSNSNSETHISSGTNTGTQKTEGTESDAVTNTGTVTESGSVGVSGTDERNTKTDGTSTTESHGAMNSVDDYLESITGKMGTKSYSELLTEYRNTFLNIDKMVLDSIKDCFLLIW